MSDSDTLLTASTKGLMRIARDSEGRNRGPDTYTLSRRIDPEGVHVVAFQMVHNDVEYRALWMVKVKDSIEPANIWIDSSFKVFDANTKILQIGELQGRELCYS